MSLILPQYVIYCNGNFMKLVLQYINTVFLRQKQTTYHLSFCETKNTLAEDCREGIT